MSTLTHAHVDGRRVLLWVLLAALAVAAVAGLVILFVGAGDVAGKVLGSILVVAAGALVAMPGEFVPWPAVQWSHRALVVVDVVLVWAVIWWGGDAPAEWLVRTIGTISALVVFVAACIAVVRASASHPIRWSRITMWVSLVSGMVLLWMAWLMTWTAGDIGIPARVIAGTAIIWAATSLAVGLIALMGGYRIVRREPPPG